ncbi:MAG TPA: metallophosphoesterase family protein [Chloroflexia bacterium]|jgi:predicted phosphodiesterase
MRTAIISDIHGNCFALDKALADLREQRVSQTVCLGDAIQGGPQPVQVVARLQELGCPVVTGNADAWLLSGIDTSTVEEVTEKQIQTREWSLSQLSDVDRDYIRAFQPTVEVPLGGGKRLLCFHGSPYSFDDIILSETPEKDFHRFLDAFRPAIMAGGHTHMQQVRRLDNTFFFNPGSIGLAYNRHQPGEGFKADAWAEYAILSCEAETLSLEFRRIPFDPNEYIQIMLSSGIPYAEDLAGRYK